MPQPRLLAALGCSPSRVNLSSEPNAPCALIFSFFILLVASSAAAHLICDYVHAKHTHKQKGAKLAAAMNKTKRHGGQPGKVISNNSQVLMRASSAQMHRQVRLGAGSEAQNRFSGARQLTSPREGR